MSICDTEKIFKCFQRHGTVKGHVTIAIHHPEFRILKPAFYGLLRCIIVSNSRIVRRLTAINHFAVLVGVHVSELRKRLPSFQRFRADKFRFIINKNTIFMSPTSIPVFGTSILSLYISIFKLSLSNLKYILSSSIL